MAKKAEKVLPKKLKTSDDLTKPQLELAHNAIKIKSNIDNLSSQLEEIKEQWRSIAAAYWSKLEEVDASLEPLHIAISGKGEISVSLPRQPKETEVVEVDLSKLTDITLKKRLFDEGILNKKMKITPAAKSSVTIEPNV